VGVAIRVGLIRLDAVRAGLISAANAEDVQQCAVSGSQLARHSGRALLRPIGYTWPYLACGIGHLVPIWQPLIVSSFHATDLPPKSCEAR
jgi:hypothetical protein